MSKDDDDSGSYIAKQEKFFNKFSRGQWKGILTTKVYQRIKDWCGEHQPDKLVVFRFLFLDDEEEKPLPIYVVAYPYFVSGRLKIDTVHLPSEKEIAKRPSQELMAVPKWVREMSLFCIPDDALVGLD